MSAAEREREHDALRQHQLDNIGTPVVTERVYELGFIDGYSVARTAAEQEHAERLARARAEAWDEAVAAMRYEDGSPVEIVSMVNPYRLAPVSPEETR